MLPLLCAVSHWEDQAPSRHQPNQKQPLFAPHTYLSSSVYLRVFSPVLLHYPVPNKKDEKNMKTFNRLDIQYIYISTIFFERFSNRLLRTCHIQKEKNKFTDYLPHQINWQLTLYLKVSQPITSFKGHLLGLSFTDTRTTHCASWHLNYAHYEFRTKASHYPLKDAGSQYPGFTKFRNHISNIYEFETLFHTLSEVKIYSYLIMLIKIQHVY